jgi:CheY-like chemotaxis protein
MSLVGNLEELSLGEILQIVSLSRKTGILSISSNGRDGSVFFRQGQVVRASSSVYVQSMGEVLIQKGIIEPDLLRNALAYQQEHGFRERLGIILVKNFGIIQDVIDDVVREQIENVVFSLFTWNVGTFRFEVRDTVDTVDSTQVDPMQFMLDQGLNSQFLAMEGTRILDEKNYESDQGNSDDESADDAFDFAFDLIDKPAAPDFSPPVPKCPIVVVDDDDATLRSITDGLTSRGYTVHALTRSEDTLIMVDSLHRSGEYPLVLIDMIMPKMDGSGVLGGIELLNLLHRNFKDLQLIVMADYQHSDAEAQVRELGYPLLYKPRRDEIASHADITGFLDKITGAETVAPDEDSIWDQEFRFDLGDELRFEMGENDDLPHCTPSQQTGEFTLLDGLLEELNNPDILGGVPLLVLRFASEYVNRAIIFTVKDGTVSGFGQFGIAGGAVGGNERIRSIHFPLTSGSLFDEPYQAGRSCTVTPALTPLDATLFESLGGGVPAEVFVGPLVSQSRVIGFLYGDNLPEQRQIGAVEPLASFLAQAGMAMEKSFLHERFSS